MIIIEWEKVSSDGGRRDAQLSSDWVVVAAAALHSVFACIDSKNYRLMHKKIFLTLYYCLFYSLSVVDGGGLFLPSP